MTLPKSAALAAAAALLMLGASTAWARAAEPLKVVASFSILGDLVAEVGREHVQVRTLVGPNGDAHVYEPAPADARDTAAASVVFVNGLGLEGWLNRLVDASGYSGPVVVASSGVTPIDLGEEKTAGMPVEEEGGDPNAATDPHAWQSVANAKVYVANIRDALIAADPAGKDVYTANATAYLAKLDALEREVRDVIAKVPADRRRVITSHNAFGYFQDAYGVTFTAPQGVSTEAEASARDVAAIITQIRKQKIPAVFLENVTDPRLVQQIARETGAKIGGTLYSDALTDAKGDATTYIDLIRHNLKQLAAALES